MHLLYHLWIPVAFDVSQREQITWINPKSEKLTYLTEKQTLTSAVNVQIVRAVPGTQVRGVRVAVLGFGAPCIETTYFAVCSIHHLYKLPASVWRKKGESKHKSSNM